MHERRYSRKDAVAAFRAIDERKLVIVEQLSGSSEDKTVQDEFFSADLEIADRHDSAVMLPVVIQKWKCWETNKTQERVLCVLCVYPNQRHTVGFPKWKIALLEDMVKGLETMHQDWQTEKNKELSSNMVKFKEIALPAPVPSVLVLGPIGSQRAAIASGIAAATKQPLVNLSKKLHEKFTVEVFSPAPARPTEEELAEAAAAEAAAEEEAAEEAAELAAEAAAEAEEAAEEYAAACEEAIENGEEPPPPPEEAPPAEEEAPPAEEEPAPPTAEERMRAREAAEFKIPEAQLIHKGQMLPDDLVVQMMEEMHKEAACACKGSQCAFVFDGGIANQSQASMLMAKEIAPQFVIVLDTPLSNVLDQFEHIVVDPADQKQYHMEEDPPLPFEETEEGIAWENREIDPDAEEEEEVEHLGPVDRVLKRREERPEALTSRYYRHYAHVNGIISTYLAAGVRVIRYSTALDPNGELTNEEMLKKVTDDILAEINAVDELQVMLPAPAPADPRAKPPAAEEEEPEEEEAAEEPAEPPAPVEFIPADGERRMTQSGKFIVCDMGSTTVQLRDEAELHPDQPLSSVWMKTPRSVVGTLSASAPADWPENKPAWWPNYFWGVLWPECIELQSSETHKWVQAGTPSETVYDEKASDETANVGALSISTAAITMGDELSGASTWVETELDACLIERKEAERQKKIADMEEQIRLAAELAQTLLDITSTEAELESAKAAQVAAQEAAEALELAKEAEDYEEPPAAEEVDGAEPEEPVDHEAVISELEEKIETLIARRDVLSPPAPPEEGDEGYEEWLEAEAEKEAEAEPEPEEEDEEEEKQPDPIKMVQVLQNAATGLYLSLDHEGTLTCTSAPGYLDGKFVGLEAHAFAYRKYVAPQEETVQFGDWRGLPNPIGTVTDSVEKWVEFVEECKALSEEAAKLYPIVPNYKATHPSAVSGPGTSVESFSAPAPGASAEAEEEEPVDDPDAAVVTEWPQQYNSSRVFHPASVSTTEMQLDPFDTIRQQQAALLEEQVEKCSVMKEVLQEELKAINCAQLDEEVWGGTEVKEGWKDNRPKDGIPPKRGSLESVRSLHHPRPVRNTSMPYSVQLLRAQSIISSGDSNCSTHTDYCFSMCSSSLLFCSSLLLYSSS